MQLIEKAPAKINLSLDALYQHTDGEFEWQMIMTSIDLADYVQITLQDSPQIEVRTSKGYLPEDKRNLAYQAAQLLRHRFDIKTGAIIEIDKHIPVAAGLGGGSSDAAAVLRGLNQLWHLGLTKAELAHIGLSIDSDVPYCVYSETALVTGKGDQIQPLGDLPNFWMVVVKPEVSVSTPRILHALNCDQITDRPQTDRLLAGIQQQDAQQMTAAMANVLTPITNQRYPQIDYLMQRLTAFGAEKAQMSGSGPTVFGICRQYSRAQRIYNSMSGFCREVYLVQPLKNKNH
ncbi:4-diphosphocytidyl-2C-methyl-D-erythritol kinase [Latilactobacillus sakei]|uniref:4-(cytidine 5'-diphospho)-2-C-methyl-D-erythritol kinase n=2 Tax=Latilactobacillus sakei TaxID=1599 RepID=UPI000502EB79|nr:4-diphosphocytidyl-2C-methyl-D-erythritol kinase [Latilactobacillus sakei]